METSKLEESYSESSKCLECEEKDELIQKYEKLVLLLKRKLEKKMSNTNEFMMTGLSQQKENGPSSFASTEKTSDCFHSIGNKIEKEEKRKMRESVDSLSSPLKKYKIENDPVLGLDQHRLSIEHDFVRTAPAGFNRPQNIETYKRISLSSEWLKKFTELKTESQKKDKRISFLTDKVFSLKNEIFCIRGIVLQLLKSLKIKSLSRNIKEKVIIDYQDKEIIMLLITLFEFSEHELLQIFGHSEQTYEIVMKVEKIDEDKSIYIPKGISAIR